MSQSRPRISVRAFVTAYTATAAFLAVFTGLFLFYAARGNDIAMVDWRFMRMTKWYIVDIHVVVSFALLLSGALFVLLRWVKPRHQESLPLRVVWSVIGCVAALYTGWYVIDEHPILIPDVRVTAHPASVLPDQGVLTWGDDPTTTQSIQWRSAETETEGQVRYRPATGGDWRTVTAETTVLEDPQLANDPRNTRFTAVLEGLQPGATYTYQAGTGAYWTPEAWFTTADSQTNSFSFVYMGDVQKGIEGWQALVEAADARAPEAAFYILAGDLVDKGCHRNQWDELFESGRSVFATRPLVPIIGNHDDCNEGGPWMYRQLLDLPENGPEGVDPERAYSFTYGNALFVALDSNLDPATQTDWLEEQLASSGATWKFVILHHPAYTSKPHRDNSEIQEAWCPIFDKYGVDLALQGHDHAYTRTYPLIAGEPVEDPNEGVNYVISVAGNKYYEQEDREFVQVAYTELSTYQIIDIQGPRLTYRAYDLQGNVVDELELVE